MHNHANLSSTFAIVTFFKGQVDNSPIVIIFVWLMDGTGISKPTERQPPPPLLTRTLLTRTPLTSCVI